MAVTLTVEQLRAAVRYGSSADETIELARILTYSTEAVTKYAPNAPDVAQDEAAIRLSAYILDMPNASRAAGYANAGQNSGAWSMLLPYRIHRAGSVVEAVAAAAASGTPGNPVTDISISGTTMTVSFADGTTRDETLPAGMGDGGGGSTSFKGDYSDLTAGQRAAVTWGDYVRTDSADGGRYYVVNNPFFARSNAPESGTNSGWHPFEAHPIWAGASGYPHFAASGDLLSDGATIYVSLTDQTINEATDLVAGTTLLPLPAGALDGAGVRALIASWAQAGDTTLMPANKYRAPTSSARGGPYAATNPVADDDGHGATSYSWGRGVLVRLIERIVPASWVRSNTALVPVNRLPRVLFYSGTDDTSHPNFNRPEMKTGDYVIAENTPTNPTRITLFQRVSGGTYESRIVWDLSGASPNYNNLIGRPILNRMPVHGEAEGIGLLQWDGGRLVRTIHTHRIDRSVTWEVLPVPTSFQGRNVAVGDTTIHVPSGTYRGTNATTLPSTGNATGDIRFVRQGNDWARWDGAHWIFWLPGHYLGAFGLKADADAAVFAPGLQQIAAFADPDDADNPEIYPRRVTAFVAGTAESFKLLDAKFGAVTPEEIHLPPYSGHLDGASDLAAALKAIDSLTTPIDIPGLTAQVLHGSNDLAMLFRAGAGLRKATLASLQTYFSSRDRIYEQMKAILAEGTNITLDEADGARSITINSAAGGGAAPRWHWAAFWSAPFTANVAKTATMRPFPIGGYADYAALRAAIDNEGISQICIRATQTDSNDADSDFDIVVLPNQQGFTTSRSPPTFKVFPAWSLGVDPVAITIEWENAGLQAKIETAIPSRFQLRLGVYK